MPSARSTNTVPEALQGVLRTLSDVMVTAAQTDPTELEFVVGLMKEITFHLGEPFQQAQPGQNAAATPMAPPADPQMAMLGAQPSPPPGGQMMNPDEFRRMMPSS